ncbi:MAG: nitrogen regulation protein NR(II) [Phycisphaerae bacterium]
MRSEQEHSDAPVDSPAEDHRTIAEIAELAGGLAHELRNPLSTMMINLKLLAEDLRDERAPVSDVRRRGLLRVEALRREAERLQALFDEFLNLTGPCRPQRSEADLNGIVGRLVEFIRPEAEAAGVKVTVAETSEPLLCPVDEMLLRQALLNILINAQEAMPDGGTLRVAIERDGDWAVVAVADSGVGIAADQHKHIWRPFYTTKGSGSGLGLSITQRIIHKHGGTLSCRSVVGRGTTFTVRLPLGCGRATGDSASR